jgi:adenylylsulfate kinase
MPFTYYSFDHLLHKASRHKVRPAVIWLTGLSGSGKTTIANSLATQLRKRSYNPVLLDGDEIRDLLKMNGFDEDARKTHNLNIGSIASLLEKQGNIVIVSLISPYIEIRDAIRKKCINFIEVHVATSLDICIKRDPKGLYKKALLGQIKDFTGISAPYFPPLKPEVTLDTSKMTVNECSKLIFTFLKNTKYKVKIAAS